MKVLVVDDEEDARTLLCDLLALEGIDPLEAGTAARALQLAAARKPDAAVIEVSLPDDSGWMLCERLRLDPRTSRVALILRSPIVNHYSRALAKSYGIDRLISKRHDGGAVVEVLRKVLLERRERRRTIEPASS